MKTQRQLSFSQLEKYTPEEGWFSFLGSLLALMTVVWSIEGANWVDGSLLLPRAAIVGFFVGFGLAKVRFVPTLLAHAFVFSVGMVFIGLLVAPYSDIQYNDWSRKLGSTVLRVIKWTQTALAGDTRDDNLVYLVMLTFGIWLIGYAAAWTLFRGRRVWWMLGMLGAVLMVNLSFNPPRAVFSFTSFIIISLLLVVRYSAYLDEQRWRSLRLYFQPGLWRGAMLVGTCLVLAIVAVAFATPSSSQVDPIGQVLDRVSQPFNGVKGIWDSVGSGGDGTDKLLPRSKANYNSLDDSFTIGGPLQLSNDPVLRITGDNTVQLNYLQGKVMDKYDGKGWISTYQSAEEKNDEALFRRLSLAANQSLPTPADQGRATNKLTVTSLVPNFTPALSLGDLVNVDRAALLAFHYEKVTINSPLSGFVLKEFGDSADGKRTVLVDNKEHPVPPALLDLVKDLKDAAKMDELALPLTLRASYTRINAIQADQTTPNASDSNKAYVRASFSDRHQTIVPETDSNGLITYNDWNYQLPALQDLDGLNLVPGGAAIKTKTLATRVWRVNTSAAQAVEMDVTVYLNASGNYTLTYESPYSRGDAARVRFEATDAGKKVLGEMKKVQEAVKGNRVFYNLANGKPSELFYEGYEPNYDDLVGAVLSQGVNGGESYTTYGRRYRADVQPYAMQVPIIQIG